VYGIAGALRAIPFDLNRLEATGAPIPVLSQLFTTPAGAADFDVAGDGTLAYVSGTAEQRSVLMQGPSFGLTGRVMRLFIRHLA
jgi:hypothetical protein